VALLGALVLTACSGAGSPEADPGAAPDATASDSDATASDSTVTTALSILETQTVDGATFDPATTTDQPVLLWFWAPWCVICRTEAPTIVDIAAELDGEVVVLGVAGRGSVEEMRGFVDDTGTAGFTHLADTDGAIWREFGVVAQPAFAFVAPDGDTEVFVGALDEDDLRSFVGDAGG
jgi:thiol-disulfide isomerase/thioredoxin